MSARYVVRPKADEDLDKQALYLAEQATAEFGHRFLIAAHRPISDGIEIVRVIHASRDIEALLLRKGI